LRQAQKEHVLFYSRGGSIPRGGGRIDAMLRAAPAESVSGVLHFTEQGDGISQNYGLRPNAMRTLERALRHAGARDPGGQARRGRARRCGAGRVRRPGGRHSAQAWRSLVYETPQFADFFPRGHAH